MERRRRLMQRDILDRHRSLRILIGLVIVALGMYVLGTIWSVLVVFGGVILLFLLAWIVAFILEPVAAFLCRRGMSRIIARVDSLGKPSARRVSWRYTPPVPIPKRK